MKIYNCKNSDSIFNTKDWVEYDQELKDIVEKAKLYDQYKNVIENHISRKRLNVCYHCDTILTSDEMGRYSDEADYCCSGYMCGCMGMPIEPPYCDQCIKTGVLATMAQKIIDNASEGWWCPSCDLMLDGSRVTHGERCDTCGTGVTWIDADWIERYKSNSLERSGM